jgi:hypothetical protein
VLFKDPLLWYYFYDGMRDATQLGRTGKGRNLTHEKIS